MRKKVFVAALCTLLVLCLVGVPVLAELAPGDSLLSKKYVDGTLKKNLTADIQAYVARGFSTENQFMKRVEAIHADAVLRTSSTGLVQSLAEAAYAAVASRGSIRTSAVGAPITLAKGDSLRGALGATVLLRSGAAQAAGSGVLIDTTEGKELKSGAALVVSHLYLQSEKTGSAVTATADGTQLVVSGGYTVTKAGTGWKQENVDLAFALRQMHLLAGTDNGFRLIAQLTRGEGLVLMLNFLGVSAEAAKTGGEMPFTDIPDWLRPYAAYAWQHKLIAGKSTTSYYYAPNDPMTATEFITLLLRCLGYSDTGGKDFTWDKSLEKAVSLGIYTKSEQTYLAAAPFVRDKTVYACYYMLDAKTTSGKTMYDTLKGRGVFTSDEGTAARKAVTKKRK